MQGPLMQDLDHDMFCGWDSELTLATLIDD